MVGLRTLRHKLRSLLLRLTLLLCASSAVAETPNITLEVEADEVYVGDTITITLESTGLIDPLDTSILSQSARYERETYGTRIFVLGGKVVDVEIRRMEFTATKTGPVVFGPVTSGEVSSNSVSVNVLDAVRSKWIPQQEDLEIDISVSNRKPYVHAQVVVDITLEHQYSIANESIELPQFDGFIVKPVYKERRTFTDESQQRRQIEWRYLLFAERSGEIQIAPVHWQGTTIKSRPERATFKRESSPVKVTIAPSASRTGSAEWWLPSSSLHMVETWSEELTGLQAGDEITRHIVVKADNVLASQIPAPTVLESRALSQTLINESRKEDITANGVLASAEFTYRLNAKSPIPVFLDTVRIPWWDTTTDSAREAIIPARRINVGLPDRADLLKRIAQESTGTSMFRLWWGDADLLRLLMYGLGGLLLVPVLVKAFGSLRAWILEFIRINSLKNKLQKLAEARKWGQLGNEIQLIQESDNSDSCFLILQTIYPALYGNRDVTINRESIAALIQSIDLDSTVVTENESELVRL